MKVTRSGVPTKPVFPPVTVTLEFETPEELVEMCVYFGRMGARTIANTLGSEYANKVVQRLTTETYKVYDQLDETVKALGLTDMRNTMRGRL